MNDSTDPSRPAPTRRLFVLGLVFVAAILSCGKDVTGPLGAAVRYARGLAFAPEFPPAYQAVGGASSGIVAFTKVHVVLHHTDASVALDTTIDFPAGADSLTLDLTVKLLNDAPASGEPMTLNLGYINAAGDTVFKGGPVSLTASPPPAGGGSNPPVKVPVTYSGPGSTATTVLISPRSGTVVAGSGFSFSAVARDQNGVVLPATPIIWNSLDPSIATITSPGTGNGTAKTLRGTARIIAQLFSGAADTVQLNVTLPATQIIAQSGNAQTGVVGTNLAQPLVVKVAASDGVGVQGTTVNFAVASGGGSVSSASVVSDASGLAQTTLKLGTTVGTNSVTATAAGLANSPLTFTATSQAATATKLVVTAQPTNGVAGTALTAVVVTAEDNNGNTATTFNGSVVVGFENNAPGATLSGTLAVNAVAGVATFSNLLINKNGTAYTLAASSTGLTGATTNAFDVSVGAPKQLVFSVQPAGGIVNAAMTPAIVVNAQDSQGNPTPSFTASVALGFATNPTSATLGGTTSVNAVAGVATFPGITVSAAGAGYALSAASAGLTSATSAPFNIGGGVATTMFVASGAGQTGPASTALASPIVIQVNDAGGNGIAGSTVNFSVVTGGGSVLPTSGVTNGAGQVQTVWTLGPGLGAQSISAASAGLTGSPLTINATATAGAATHLVFVQQPTNAVAGVAIAPAITIVAKDASNNTDATYVGNVSISFGTHLGSAVLSGTTTVAAVAGVATFNNLSIQAKFAGYTFIANSGALTVATSNAFNISSAAATTLAVSSGQGQSGFTSSALGVPVGAIATDAFGNGVPGITVSWAAAGGGSMAPPSSVTSAAGIAISSWTLGSTPGAQTATATSAGLAGSPLTFNATATLTGFSKTWTGSASTSWGNALNWLPNGVPAATDSVFIPSGGNQPTISTSSFAKNLTVGAGAVLTFSGAPTLTINGTFIDNGATVGAGSVLLTGIGTVGGPIAQTITLSGTYTAGATTTLAAPLAVSGSLDLNGQTVIVNGAFQTTGSGTIKMNSASTLTVTGDITFGGGSETGLITAGTIIGAGNFSQSGSATSFVATGTNVVQLSAAAVKSVTMASPTTATFQSLLTANTAGLTLATDITVTSGMTIVSGTVNGAGRTVTVGSLVDAGPGLAVSTVVFTGSALSGPAVINANVAINNNPTLLNANITVNGSVSVTGNLQLNSHYLTVNGNFATFGSGQLTMTNAADSMQVNGTVTFSGGSTGGIMSNGKLKLTGNFSQATGTGAGGEFQGTAAHQVVFNGVAAQTVTFANPGTSTFGNVTFSNTAGVTLATNVVSGGVTLTAGAVTGAAVGFTINGTLTDPSTLLAVAAISFVNSATPVSATTPVINSNVTFNTVALLAANLTVNGGVSVNSAAGSISANGHTFTINGSFGTSNSGALAMSNAADLVIVNGNATFAGGAAALTNGVLQISGNFSQTTAATAFAASSPHITRFTGATPTISFANPASSNFGTLQLQTSGAVTFATNAATSYDIWLKTGTTPSVTGAVTVTAGRAIYDTTGGRWQVANTVLSGNGALPKAISTNLTFGAALILVDSLKLTGNALVSGAAAQLDLNGHYMKVTGTFGTASGGVLQMIHVNDSLIVKGNASFNGGSTAGKLTAGYFEFDGSSFVQGVNAAAFSADTPHLTWFWGSTQQSVAFANPAAASSHFGNLYLQDTATVLNSDMYLNGQLQTGGQASFHVKAAAGQLVTSNGANLRNVVFDNVRWKTAGTSGAGLFPSIDNVTFQNISQTTLPQFDFEYSTVTNLTLAGFTFNTLPTGAGSYIKIVGPDTLTMTTVSPGLTGGFVNLSSGGAILGWSNIATWTGATASTNWQTPGNWNTNAVPTSTTDVLIPVTPYTPTTTAAAAIHALTVNSGATVRLNGGNLSVNGDLTVVSGGNIDITGAFSLSTFANVIADTAGPGAVTTCASGNGINIQSGAHTVKGRFCNLYSFGNITASGPIVVDTVLAAASSTYSGNFQQGSIGPANFTLAGNSVRIRALSAGAGGNGTITMTNVNDSLIVSGSALFNGAASTGLMTAGNVIISGPTFSATGLAYDASGTHTTTFNGVSTSVGTQTVGFGSAVPGHGFQNLTFRNSSRRNFSGEQWIVGTLTFDVSNTGFGTDGSYPIHVNTQVDNSSIAGGSWNGSTILHMTGNGTFNRDTLRVNTVEFDGGGNFILSHNLITNYIVVDSSSGLVLNGHRVDTQGNYFYTQHGGVLGMTTVGDSLIANQLYFNGGSTVGALTKGGINVTGPVFGVLYQGYSAAHTAVAGVSATAFAPSGTRVWFNPSYGANVEFQNPGSGGTGSHFWSVQATNGAPISLLSNIVIDSVLKGDVSGDTWQSDSAAQNIVRAITTAGIINSAYNLALKAVRINLNDGVAPSSFSNVTWTNFPTISSGALFTQNRTSSGLTIDNQTYTGTSFSGGDFAFNAGSVTLTLGSLITGGTGACISASLGVGVGCH